MNEHVTLRHASSRAVGRDAWSLRITVVSILLYYAEELIVGSEHSHDGPPCFLWAERLIALYFTFELTDRWKKAAWSLRHMSTAHFWIDVVAVGPFFVGFFVPTDALHLVRTLRLLRLFKLLPFMPGVRLLALAIARAWPQIRTLMAVQVMITMFSTAAMFECERNSPDSAFTTLFDSIWFTAVTVTTVGYGDITPVTIAGRIIALLTFMTGLILFAVFAGVVGSALTDILQEDQS